MCSSQHFLVIFGYSTQKHRIQKSTVNSPFTKVSFHAANVSTLIVNTYKIDDENLVTVPAFRLNNYFGHYKYIFKNNYFPKNHNHTIPLYDTTTSYYFKKHKLFRKKKKNQLHCCYCILKQVLHCMF